MFVYVTRMERKKCLSYLIRVGIFKENNSNLDVVNRMVMAGIPLLLFLWVTDGLNI